MDMDEASNSLEQSFSKAPETGRQRSVSSVRILVVEDFEPFRRRICSILSKRPDLQVIAEVSDGLEAVRKAEELQPDLIILDIGLPTLNGIEAARRIRKLSPESKILFLSHESSPEVAQEALRLGALGYVVKVQAGGELLIAIDTVRQGRQFIGAGLPGGFAGTAPAPLVDCQGRKEAALLLEPRPNVISHPHEVQFYLGEMSLLESCTLFVATALKAGDTVVVVATESHRKSLFQRLPAHGLDSAVIIEEQRYISLDAAEILSTFMEAAGPSRERFLRRVGSVIRSAEAAAATRHKRVVVFGEMVMILCAEGKVEAALKLERLWNELAQTSCFSLRCAYPMTDELKGQPYAMICAEHSAVLSAAI
jgi:DNA-binding NarL/FixJ family response regulator